MTNSNDTTITFTLESKPFKGDPPYANDFYSAIGRVVVLWGRMETALDIVLRMAINIARAHGIDEEMQVSLRRKTKLLRSIYPRCPPLADQADYIRAFTAKVEDAGNDRTTLVHSSVQGFEDGPPPRILLRAHRYKSEKILILEHKSTLEEIAALAAGINRLNDILALRLLHITRLQPGFEKLQRSKLPTPPEADQSPPIPE